MRWQIGVDDKRQESIAHGWPLHRRCQEPDSRSSSFHYPSARLAGIRFSSWNFLWPESDIVTFQTPNVPDSNAREMSCVPARSPLRSGLQDDRETGPTPTPMFTAENDDMRRVAGSYWSGIRKPLHRQHTQVLRASSGFPGDFDLWGALYLQVSFVDEPGCSVQGTVEIPDHD